MTDENIHNLALQLSEVAQKYEQYWQEIAVVGAKYEELPVWVERIVGELTPNTRELLYTTRVVHDSYIAQIGRCRTRLLDTAQKLMRHG